MYAIPQSIGSAASPIMMVDKGDSDRHHNSHNMMLAIVAIIFVIFIIFAIIIFMAVFARRDNRHEGIGAEVIAPLAAGFAAKGVGCNHDDYKMWDHSRDDLKEQGYIKMEMKENAWKSSDLANKNHYETSRQLDQNSWKAEKAIDCVKAEVAASERRILDRIAYIEDKRKDEIIAQQRQDIWGERLSRNGWGGCHQEMKYA